MKKVAIPLINNQLSQHFEQGSDFVFFTIENNYQIKRDLVQTHIQSEFFPHWLSENGITDVITSGIELHTASKLNQFKINVFAGVIPSDPLQLVKDFLNGTLETNVILEKN